MAQNGSKFQHFFLVSKLLEMTPNSSNWLQIYLNGSKLISIAQNDSKWLEMAPKVLDHSNKKSKKGQNSAKIFLKT